MSSGPVNLNPSPARSIRVAVVDDDPNFRNSIVKLLKTTDGYECVAECASGEEGLDTIPLRSPDVVLMDIGLPGRDGIQCVAELHQRMPNLLIIMVTIDENIDRVFESLKAGATGYLVKLAQSNEILNAIAEVHRGGAPMSSTIARRLVTAFRAPPPAQTHDAVLSPREEEVLRLIAGGERTKDIADLLSIGKTTVDTHIRNIYEKLHVRSRAEAVARYKNLSPAPPNRPR